MSLLVTHTFSAQFVDAHYDYADDADFDGDFDTLYIVVAIEAIEDTNVYLDIYLQDVSTTTFSQYSGYLNVSAGLSYVEGEFSGEEIFANGVDGPYYVDMVMYDEYWNPIDYYYDYETGAYAYIDFDPPAAVFAPPHTDSAVDDTDSNSQYDYLVVTASVMVYEPGLFLVSGELYDVAWGSYIQYEEIWMTLGLGLNTVDLTFPSFPINNSGLDGPYRVDMDIYWETYDLLDSDQHMTAWYDSDSFEGARAAFVTPFGEMTTDA